MAQVSTLVGQKIRNFRKRKNLTLEEFGQRIYKSKATLSKYESGEIKLDVDTLYQIAGALDVQVNQLMPDCASVVNKPIDRNKWLNRQGKHTRMYSYFYCGVSNSIVKCVIDFESIPGTDQEQKMVFYKNVKNFQEYPICESIYYGHVDYFEGVTNMYGQNIDSKLDHIQISMLGSYIETQYKFGIMSGISAKPIMPVSIKMMFSSQQINDEEELNKLLKISKDDVRLMKLNNMFTVI